MPKPVVPITSMAQNNIMIVTYYSSSDDTFNSSDNTQSPSIICHTNPANGAPLTGDCGSSDIFGNSYGGSGCRAEE